MDETMIAASPENTMAVYGFSNMDEEEEEVPVSPTDNPVVVVPPVPVADGTTTRIKCNKKKRMIFYGPRRYDSDLVVSNLLLIVLLYTSLRFIRSQ